MTVIRNCFTVTVLIFCSTKTSYSEEHGLIKKSFNEDLYNVEHHVRFRRHTDVDLYQQSNDLETLNNRIGKTTRDGKKSNFLTNFKRKMISFLTRRKRKHLSSKITRELDNGTIFIKSQGIKDNKINSKINSTGIDKSEKELQTLDLTKLQKILANYQKVLRSLKKETLRNRKQLNVNQIGSSEERKNSDRKKRQSEKMKRIKHKHCKKHTTISD